MVASWFNSQEANEITQMSKWFSETVLIGDDFQCLKFCAF